MVVENTFGVLQIQSPGKVL